MCLGAWFLDLKRRANVTAATLFRVIDQYCPTLLLDEVDTYLKDDPGSCTGSSIAGLTRSAPRCSAPFRLAMAGRCANSRPGARRLSPASGICLKLSPIVALRSIFGENSPPRQSKGWVAITAVRWSTLRERPRAGRRTINESSKKPFRKCRTVLTTALPTPGNSASRSPTWLAVNGLQRARAAALEVSGDGTAENETTRIKLLSDIRDIRRYG